MADSELSKIGHYIVGVPNDIEFSAQNIAKAFRGKTKIDDEDQGKSRPSMQEIYKHLDSGANFDDMPETLYSIYKMKMCFSQKLTKKHFLKI